MPDKSTQSNSDIPLQKPGELLKEAREKLGLSQKDVAAQLNLKLDILDAVERNDDEKLPASTYVRGYIRSYAKIVKLDGDALISLYENDASGPPEIIPDIKNHSQVSSADKPVKAVTYFVTFALALLLIAWLQSNYVIDKKSPVSVSTTNNVLEEYRENSNPPGGKVQQEPPESAQYSVNAPVASGLSVETGGNAGEISENVINTPDLPDALAIEPETDADESDVGSTAVEETDTLPTSEDTIFFKLDRDSWIEVYDSGHNMLFKRLAKSGEELTLSGIGPFSVLLGYAPGVEVKFNGEPFDPGPYTNAGIARFKLGEQDNPE